MSKNYEAVFILTPVLSETQMKDAVDKFKGIIKDAGGKVTHDENWGLKKLAYPIQHKSTGFYQLFEFDAPSSAIATLETEFRRDERVMRFLTIALDKYSLEYNEKRRKGSFNKPKEEEVAS